MNTDHLNELDKIEFWDVVRALKPGMTHAEYSRMWNEFQKAKEEHYHQMRLQ